MGQPVGGNPTQYIMEKAFAAAGLDARFLTLEVPPQYLADAVRGIRAMGFRGAVLLDPHRAEAAKYVDQLSRAAELIGQVNFIQRHDDQLVGDNTVGKGVIALLRESIDPAGQKVVILGAGSAGRAIAVELALARTGELVIVNRTVEPGQELVELLTQRMGATARFVHWVDDFAPPDDVAILIQATSIGADGGKSHVPLNFEPVRSGTVVIDMRINPLDAEFLREASARNLAALDGLDVLVKQSTIAFKNWTDVDPDQRLMHEALEEFLMV
jgi:shikimate dehydrogenase